VHCRGEDTVPTLNEVAPALAIDGDNFPLDNEAAPTLCAISQNSKLKPEYDTKRRACILDRAGI
jgi:hypothetical protein